MTTKHFLMAGLAILTMAGCGSGGDNGGGTGEATSGGTTGTNAGGTKKTGNLTIAVIPKGSTHEYWKGVHAGADAAAKEYNGTVTIKWQGPVNEGDKENQISIVDSAVSGKVDGIVLAPLDEHALASPVKNANKANIPVAIIDSGITGADMLSFIATDNYKGGTMAATELAKELGDKGNVAMLRYEPGSASTEAREKGFLDEMAKHAGIKIISSDQFAHTTADTAQKASENLFARFKKADGSPDFDGFYAPNESSTFGTLRTLENMHWAGKIKFVGFDSSDKLVEGLKSGEINGLIIQNPYKMGYLGVKSVVDFLRDGKKPEAKVDTGATLVTKDNMTDPEVAKILAPPHD